jgi:predicted GNAT superfamily acetyltransferase
MVDELTELADLRELEAIFGRVWERTAESPINSETLRALSHSGAYVSGARVGDRLVGGLVGWLGGRPPDDLHLHSHILGVVPDTQVRGVGFELKQHQRTWCLERGVGVIQWTFDPLVRRNAYFNFNKLGASASAYLVNFYGAMADRINAGDESDRLLVSWDIGSERAVAAAAGKFPELRLESLERDGAIRILEVGPSGQPLSTESDAGTVLVQVPEDIVELRRSDLNLARRWRTAAREALSGAMRGRRTVMGVTRSGWYVLERG